MIEYGFGDSLFGEIIVARSPQGICDVQFLDHNKLETIHELATRWGLYTPTTRDDEMARRVIRVIFDRQGEGLALDLRGTAFRQRVWQVVRQIAFGQTASYRDVAAWMGCAQGVRAVATAVAQNPVAMLVPCHRVIHSDGTLGEYHWGRDLKRRLIDWETAQVAAPIGQ